MSDQSDNQPIRWAAKLSHVRDVTILGTADLAYWQERLSKKGLALAEKNGRAQILIIAADLKFKGVRFREVSFSVLLAPSGDSSQQDAAYLCRAYNSNWLFAFCERTCFSTPYDYADVRVSTSLPLSIELTIRGKAVFEARMNSDNSRREPSRQQEEGWEGPVFLPNVWRGNNVSRRLFYAQIRGATKAYPFLAQDSMAISPSSDSETLQSLIESNFTTHEWTVREDARHAKSKTYSRAMQ